MESPAAQPVPECLRCRELEARILVLETKLRDLEDRLKGPAPKRPVEPQPPAPKKKPTGEKRGAQPGHKPHLKSWLPAERVKEVVDHIPEVCWDCDQPLSPTAGPDDPPPTIHQVVELPPTLVEVVEHRGHSRTCACGCVTKAAIPASIRAHSVGPQLTATVAYLSGSHGMSKRGIEEVVETLFGAPIAVGTISNLERETSAALESAYFEARKAVADAEVKHLDETGWKEGGKKRWLWVAATASAVVFAIDPKRSFAALRRLLGKVAGILVSDRWGIYDKWDGDLRQLCWAHIERNWDKQIERGGKKAKALGERWQAVQKSVFELWHLFRGGGCTRAELDLGMVPHVESLMAVLEEGIRSRDAAVSRFCQRLLDRYPMLWLFVAVDGVEPTNNHAERVQRRAVLWRRKSFGCDSGAGCRFAERILTVIQTLRLQKRNALEFLGQTLRAHRDGGSKPVLCTVG